MQNGDEKAKLAYDIFIDRLQKYIGQYLAVLNGADAIIFTAGIGENAVNVRSSIINGISWFGSRLTLKRTSLELLEIFPQMIPV